MPSSTPKQKRTMAAAAHNPAFAKKMGIPVSVAQEFNRADTGKRTPSYAAGGSVTYHRAPGSFAEGGPPLRRS